ncbi:MAG TPA: acetyl-CoA carboxylase, carboxyltransferase subunit beta [candidate division Zixibacteria bacterium]|nr:acetyl-CoA carboxylase carboxyltransferase subunit beta [candidate division Zixibacteria bacterium]MDD4916470.1 acetyl-CoA carboxylase, carboxyltransferase subunit beta [candidate division Zixibacteria bacterium]MDM7971867.1 acetyl-CoA carboxylase, carboxyltransferase subunit beta [candidate division Zixibacteria bacterium]HOD65105.1 acetyl-CoA carboxylase, carboxyltransferase subunit beta [candidate division Zixibacteria bacterium]HOZ08794.1 acetyl-CoA carboxylase, carboxyltransferase subun
MAWFRKDHSGPVPQEKKNIPEGLWIKCDSCGEIIYSRKLEKLLWVCPSCDFHFRITSQKYIDLLLDGGRLEEFDSHLTSRDPLKFKDSKKYPDRIREAQAKAGRLEGVIAGIGEIGGIEVSFAIMNFAFIGGSMGSVVGEMIARAIERALNRNIPLVIVSSSGGARMQEGILSLMQMAKTSGLLERLDKKRIPYISILTNPTTAGVMASYASLGDVVIAEPKALLGFAGPRVIQQTIKQELPEGFQSSEFFLEKGFLDKIVHRKDLRDTVIALLKFMWRK